MLVALTVLLLVRGRQGREPLEFLAVDLPLLLLCAVRLPALLRSAAARPRRIGVVWGLFLGMWALLAYACVADPTANGVATLLRLLGAAVLADTVARLSGAGARAVLAATVVGVAGLEAVLAVAQRLSGEPIGLQFLGERQQPFYLVGTTPSPKGTFSHPYLLAALCVLAIVVAIQASAGVSRRRAAPWLAAGCLAGVPVGLTYSRMALAAVAAVAAVCLLASRRGQAGLAWRVGIVVAGIVVAGACSLDGWATRARLFDSHDLDTVSSLRVTQAKASLAEVRAQPVVGAGPGRLAAEGRVRAHNVPLLVAVEGGVLAGVAATGLLLAIGAVAARRGPLNVAVYVAYLPFVLLDRFPYDTAQGLAMTGLWVGGALWSAVPAVTASATETRRRVPPGFGLGAAG